MNKLLDITEIEDFKNFLIEILKKDKLSGYCNYLPKEYIGNPNPLYGYCAISSQQIHRVFGLPMKRIFLPNNAIHVFNILDGEVFDVTQEQFVWINEESAKFYPYTPKLPDYELDTIGEEKRNFSPDKRYRLIARTLFNEEICGKYKNHKLDAWLKEPAEEKLAEEKLKRQIEAEENLKMWSKKRN